MNKPALQTLPALAWLQALAPACGAAALRPRLQSRYTQTWTAPVAAEEGLESLPEIRLPPQASPRPVSKPQAPVASKPSPQTERHPAVVESAAQALVQARNSPTPPTPALPAIVRKPAEQPLSQSGIAIMAEPSSHPSLALEPIAKQAPSVTPQLRPPNTALRPATALPPTRRQHHSPPPLSLQLHIGRIDIQLQPAQPQATPPPPPASRPSPGGTLSLADYLRQRKSAGGRS
ncbi:hypothetical protein HNP55_001439 [Paucibacter oligotrophus]|uniref:Uncharacterized protein n=1 Tax=Roseateles oligotrophus TaxID=1769250 RepID=A0A840L357_9BURK|nr:hypothetical protein [Roseateles oligotrophus]MBB4842924.1 hypothetical protein [Roseateles oligotrophus]